MSQPTAKSTGFARTLARLMLHRGESQRALGAALGVSHKSVGDWLRGATPHRSRFPSIATHYGVSVDALISQEDDPNGASIAAMLDAPRIPSTPAPSAPTDFIQGGYTGVDLAKGTDETRVLVVREEKAAPDGAWLKTYKNDYDRFSDVLLRPAGWLHMWRDFTQNSVFDFCFIQGMRLGEKAPTTVALDGQKPIPENIRESYTTAFSDLSRLLLGKTVSGVVLRGHLGEMFLEFTDGSTVAIGVCLYEGNGIMTCGRAVAMEGKR